MYVKMSDRREEGELRIQEAMKAYRSGLKDDYGTVEKAAEAHGVKRSTLGSRLCGTTKRSRIEEGQRRQKLSGLFFYSEFIKYTNIE